MTPIYDNAPLPSTCKAPNFFIIGAPKCGTTSLYHYFKEHSEVFMPEVKEPEFFSSDITISKFADLSSYLEMYRPRNQQSRAGDASPWSLYSPSAPQRIKTLFPNADIIVTLRNPIDMIYSLHSQLCFNHGGEDILDFEKALEAEPERAAGKYPKSNEMVPIYYQYRKVGRYHHFLKNWIEAFDRDHIKIILHDELATNTSETFGQLCDFLSISRQNNIDFSTHNENKRHRSRMIAKSFIHPNEALKRIGRAILPKVCRDGIVNSVLNLNTNRERRPPMCSDLRSRLALDFAPDIETLADLIDKDLSAWLPRG